MTFDAAAATDSDSTVDTIFALRRTTGRSLASDCYDVGRAFVDESPFWGKAELAMWLLGPYSQVAQDVREVAPASRPSLRQIDVCTVQQVIANAHAEVLYALQRLEDPEAAADLAFEMIAAGFIAQTVDANGASAWVPTTAAHRLADRVISLFVADFMTRVFSADVELALAA
jgi:hypothetical protein